MVEVRKKKGTHSNGKKNKEGSRGVEISREVQGEGATRNRSSSKEIQRRELQQQGCGEKEQQQFWAWGREEEQRGKEKRSRRGVGEEAAGRRESRVQPDARVW